MKKIFLLLTVFSMVFTSCEPLEDIYTEIDAQAKTIVGDVTFTMSDDDYDELGLSFGNFSTEADAKTKIPDLLKSKYPVWGNKSSATVTFKLYNKKNTEKSLITYTVQPADYTAVGNNYGSLSSMSQIVAILDYKYPTPADRVLVALTYEQYDSGITTTVENGFIYSNGAWEKSMGITLEEYQAMGEPRQQFSNEDEAKVKIPLFLKNKLQYEAPEAGDIQGVMYKLYVSGSVNSYVLFFIYDGSNWALYDNTINETIQFGHDGTNWIPDNTIKYTLARNADYAYMASQLTGSEYAGLISNLAFYGDFDYNWTTAQIQYALTLLLEHLDPNAADGQKYVLTYVLYDNGEKELQMSFIKTNGSWVLN